MSEAIMMVVLEALVGKLTSVVHLVGMVGPWAS